MSHPPTPKLLTQVSQVLDTQARLTLKNKEAAKEQLLRIQLILAKKPLSYKYK
jgi:hypothetical protein